MVYLYDVPREIVKHREGQKPIFIPISFAREIQDNGHQWEKEDPDYQDLVELSRDGNKQRVVMRELISGCEGGER